ncbi:MAG TPA: twin-arginine translocase TatA/TatE family subunit [Gammaproteobacteria bacterium]|jgi:sec-independent protein translocase protein TatA
MEGISFGKILLLLIIVMLVFGTAKLPKIGEDLGKAVRSFKKAANEGDQPAEGNVGAPKDKH